MSRATLPGVLALVLLPMPLRAGEMYAITVKPPAAGDSIRVEREETRTTRTTVHDGLGRKVLDRQDKEVETLVYRETTLRLARDGEPTEFRRTYEKAQLKAGSTTRTLPYHGVEVLFRQEKGKFHFTCDNGKELSAEDAAPLDREYNGGDEKFRFNHLLPGKAVQVGADWPIDMKPLVKDFLRTGRFGVDTGWVRGSGHLNKTTPAGGAQFGQLYYQMEMPILSMALAAANRSPVLAGSKARFELTLDLCIDGTRPDATILGTAEVKTAADLPQAGGLPSRLTFLHKVDSREVRKGLLRTEPAARAAAPRPR